jgi:hypothetical protein
MRWPADNRLSHAEKEVAEMARSLMQMPALKELDLPDQAAAPARKLMRKLGLESM